MDLLSILTGSENLYKYLFLGGLGLVVLAIFYPLNQKYNLQVQRDDYNNQAKVLNLTINDLKSVTDDANTKTTAMLTEIKGLHSESKESVAKQQFLKDSANRQLVRLTGYNKETHVKELELEYANVKIETLTRHIKDFASFELVFIIVGSVCFIWGTFGWFNLMKKGMESKR